MSKYTMKKFNAHRYHIFQASAFQGQVAWMTDGSWFAVLWNRGVKFTATASTPREAFKAVTAQLA